MPLANWNGKFQGVGNGGLAGFITFTIRIGTGGRSSWGLPSRLPTTATTAY